MFFDVRDGRRTSSGTRDERETSRSHLTTLLFVVVPFFFSLFRFFSHLASTMGALVSLVVLNSPHRSNEHDNFLFLSLKAAARTYLTSTRLTSPQPRHIALTCATRDLQSTPMASTTMSATDLRAGSLPALNSTGHVAHCRRCLDGLPASLVEMDASRYV